MGGTIGVDSREGQGSTFWFTVEFELGPQPSSEPRGSNRLRTSSRTASSAKTPRRASWWPRITPPTATWLWRNCEKLGYQANAVPNGAEAVQAVEQGSYDLVLMDCEMPVMDGYEATRRIRAARPAFPIIALTADAMSGDRDRCLSEGMDDYLAKPVDLERLAEVLAKWLGAKTEPSRQRDRAGEPYSMRSLWCGG